MNTTEMNLAIAGIKKLELYLPDGKYNPKYWQWPEVASDAPCWIGPDYLSPELNHGLVMGLIKKGWEPAYIDDVPWLTGTMCGWKNKKLDISIWNDDFNTATALAYIEAFK